jgi:hypothetical protein
MRTTGKLVDVLAEITEYLTTNGTQISIATIGKRQYKVIDRDANGPIFGSKKYFDAQLRKTGINNFMSGGKEYYLQLDPNSSFGKKCLNIYLVFEIGDYINIFRGNAVGKTKNAAFKRWVI